MEGYDGADVARLLGILSSTEKRLAVSDELPAIEKYV